MINIVYTGGSWNSDKMSKIREIYLRLGVSINDIILEEECDSEEKVNVKNDEEKIGVSKCELASKMDELHNATVGGLLGAERTTNTGGGDDVEKTRVLATRVGVGDLSLAFYISHMNELKRNLTPDARCALEEGKLNWIRDLTIAPQIAQELKEFNDSSIKR